MDSNQVLILIIIITLAISVIMVMPKFFKIIGMLLLNCGVGLFCLYFINLIAPMHWQVGLNFLTGAIVSILGLPGVALLYAIQIMI
ncbi:pro-sigmaK processing inhibitor BofA family protein [Vallitalea okinawensis]|uniref:pro-sigmaK processing inhibitor BofA family protein n=1 Tax=Vallitalea okinawensis TaxID=2078660 RepID=UPI000CFCB055|nr:pro-sigmaK processing inhibitor BofA family protein [Vallitalea okinawensis]